MRARKLFESTDDLSRTRAFVAAMIILQTKGAIHHSTLLGTEIIWTHAIPTAATDGVYVYINPDFWRSLPTDGQRAFLLAHEVSHIIFRHPQRGKAYRKRGFFSPNMKWDGHLYNVAGDYVINADLVAMGFEPIPEGLYSDKYQRDDVVDSVYADLYRDKPESGEAPQGQPDSNGDGEDEQAVDPSANPAPAGGDQGTDQDADSDSVAGDDATDDKSTADKLPTAAGHDYHLEPEYEGTPEEQINAEAEDIHDIEQAIDRAIDQMGEEGADIDTIPEHIRGEGTRHTSDKRSDVNWNVELADWVTKIGKGEKTSLSRINVRRYATLGVISPSSIGEFRRLAVISDISGSVYDSPFYAYRNELAAIQDAISPTEGVMVLWTNHEVQRVDEAFSSDELLNLSMPYKCGGTRMAEGLDWLAQNGVETDLVMVFTDGQLMDSDWERLAGAENLLVVLDRTPDTYTSRQIKRVGVDHIVAEAA